MAMIELVELPDSADARMLRGAIDHVQTWVCFCSLYGDCWENQSDDYQPTRIGRCVDDPARRFQE